MMKVKVEGTQEEGFKVEIDKGNEQMTRLNNVQLSSEEYAQLKDLMVSILMNHIVIGKKKGN